jgi:hypothetical protein
MRLNHSSCSICGHQGPSSPSELLEPPAEAGPSPPRLLLLGDGQALAAVSPLRMPLPAAVDAGVHPLRMPLPGKGQASGACSASADDEWAFSVGQTLGAMLAGENGCGSHRIERAGWIAADYVHARMEIWSSIEYPRTKKTVYTWIYKWRFITTHLRYPS